jgi:YVTN family beta-propeller protein
MLLVLGVVALAPPAAGRKPAPVVSVFPVTYLSQQQVTGRVVSKAVPVPPAAIGFFVKWMGDPVGGPASASVFIEYSSDGGVTWALGDGAGGPLGTPFGSGLLGGVRGSIVPTHARAVIDVTGTAILTMTGEFYAPIGVEITPIPVGGDPWGVALNPVTKLLYVVDGGGNHNVSVIDTKTDAIVGHIVLSDTHNYFGAAVNPVTNRIYVAGSDSVEVIDGNTNSLLGSLVVGPHGFPNAIAVNPRTNLIYATNLVSGTLTVVDGVTHGILAQLSVGRLPSSVVVNPETNRIYVASRIEDPITVIDGETNGILTTISTGLPSRGMAVNPGTDRLYVSTFTGHSVLVIDSRTNQVAASVPLGSVIDAVAVDPVRNRIYAVSEGPLVTHSTPYVFMIDGETHHVISAVPIMGCCPRPDGTVVRSDTERVYVGGGGGGTGDIVNSFQDDFSGRADLVDLAISASALPGSVVLGTDSQLTVTLSNVTKHGRGTATNVTAWLRFHGARFISATSSDATCGAFFSSSVLRCVVNELENDETVSITVDVQPERSGLIEVIGSVSADQVDVDASNNEVYRTTTATTQ